MALTDSQRSLLAFIDDGGKTPDEVAAFLGEDEGDLQALVASGYVVLNGTALADTRPETAAAPPSVLRYALTYAGQLEVP